MTELTLFASSFLVVLLLGLQSLNVNNGHFILAALTSFGIGSMQMVMFKLAPHATWSEIAAFHIGDNPGRKEPITGEINYKNIFKHLHQKGFQGVLGMEHGRSGEGKAGERAVIEAYRACDAF